MPTNGSPAGQPTAAQRLGRLGLQVGCAIAGGVVAAGWLFGFLLLFSYAVALSRGIYEPPEGAALKEVVLSAVSWCLPTLVCLGYLIGPRTSLAASRSVGRQAPTDQQSEPRLAQAAHGQSELAARRLAFHRWLAVHGRYAADRDPAGTARPGPDWS
jgi:hypothetical protein